MQPAPHSARVQIFARTVTLATEHIPGRTAGNYVEFEIRDNGAGIAPPLALARPSLGRRQRGPLAALVSCEVERASKLLVTEWVIQLHKAYRALAQAGYASVCAPVSLAAHHGVCPASLGRKLAARQDKSNPQCARNTLSGRSWRASVGLHHGVSRGSAF
jgi:hypothetical protein